MTDLCSIFWTGLFSGFQTKKTVGPSNSCWARMSHW